uniref:Chromosome 10 open reading frame 62 n=1 Tax=Bos mutus grunniens TaxID=30521 RepID=A0A8B9XZX4_BOSMU
MQRKRKRKTDSETSQEVQEPTDSEKLNDESWIKSHFSRLSEEKLATSNTACLNTAGPSSSAAAPQPDSGSGEASTTIHVETFTTRQGDEGMALHRESFTSKQRMSGTSVTKETHKESGKSSSVEEATWAAVAACTKEIDTKGQQLANSMLQRATACQNSGHLETKDINQEELKALEEVEMKLKNFLTQRESTVAGANHTPPTTATATMATRVIQTTSPTACPTAAPRATTPLKPPNHRWRCPSPAGLRESTVAGANHTHTYHSHCHHGHQGYPNHQSHSLPNRSPQGYHPFKAT